MHGIRGLAKDFGLSGLTVGVPHTRDPQVRTAARALAHSAPVSHTLALVTNVPSDARLVAEFLAGNRRRPLAAGGIGYLERAGIDRRPHLPAVSAAAKYAPWQRIPRSVRVKILPGTAFAGPEPGWFRLRHATDASIVAAGIVRLIRALETS